MIPNTINKDTTKFSYKLLGDGPSYGMDTLISENMDVDEKMMAVTFPFGDGNRRDGVGDLLEVGGIDTSRHIKNPIVLIDHAKVYSLPVALTEDPHTKEYTVSIDPISKVARAKAFFYQGKGLTGMDKSVRDSHALYCEQLFDLVCRKFIRAGSIGYAVKMARPIQADYERGIPKGNHLLSVLMLECSFVVLPANQDTVMKALSLPNICGKPLSPYLVKSLTPHLPTNRKIQVALPHGDFSRTKIPAPHSDPPVPWEDAPGSGTKEVKGSYFDECPRDARGHCKPKGTGSETTQPKEEPKKTKVPKKEVSQPRPRQNTSKKPPTPRTREDWAKGDQRIIVLDGIVAKSDIPELIPTGSKPNPRWLRQNGWVPLRKPSPTQKWEKNMSTIQTKAIPMPGKKPDPPVTAPPAPAVSNPAPPTEPGSPMPDSTPMPETAGMGGGMNAGGMGGGMGEAPPEKYSAQVLRRIHQDFNMLMQDYDGMLGPMEHDPTVQLIGSFLQQFATSLDLLETHFRTHHNDLPGLNGEPPGMRMMPHSPMAPDQGLAPTEEPVLDEGMDVDMVDGEPGLDEEIDLEDPMLDEGLEGLEDEAEEGAPEVEEEENPEDDAARESGKREPVPAEDAVEGMKKGKKKDKPKKKDAPGDKGEKSLSLRDKYRTKAFPDKRKPKKDPITSIPPPDVPVHKAVCSTCGEKGCKCGVKSLEESSVLGKSLEEHEKSHVGEAISFLDRAGADDAVWDGDTRADCHYFSRIFSKMAEMEIGEEDQKGLEDGTKTIHAHRQTCKDAASYFKGLSKVKAFGNPHRHGAKAWHKILSDLLTKKDEVEEELVPTKELDALPEGSEMVGEMNQKELDEVIRQQKEVETLSKHTDELNGKLDLLLSRI